MPKTPPPVAPTLDQLTHALAAANLAVPSDDAAMDAYLRVQIVETHALLRDEYARALHAQDWGPVRAAQNLANAAMLANIAATLRQGLPQSARNHRLEIVVERREPAACGAVRLEAAATVSDPLAPPEPDADGCFDPFAFPEGAFHGANGLVDAAMMREVCNHRISLNDARMARGLAPMPGFPPAGAPIPPPSGQS